MWETILIVIIVASAIAGLSWHYRKRARVWKQDPGCAACDKTCAQYHTCREKKD